MKLVMSLVARDEADIVEEQIAFHLNAGVDFVIATDHGSTDGTAEILESYVREGLLRRIPQHGEARDGPWRTQMAHLALTEYDADWVLDAEADEFWMPRGENLKDILVAIPPRYGVVQALVRVFLPRPEDAKHFAERMTVRRAPYAAGDEAMGKLEWALRPVYRASADLTVGGDRESAFDGRVPLRAWYPIEVFRFPLRSLEQAERRVAGRAGPPGARSRIELDVLTPGVNVVGRWEELVIDDDELTRGVADGSLVVDERLRDALGRLESASAAHEIGRRFALPANGVGHLDLRAPTVVDDVAYAGECAAVREVDFEPLRKRIVELEERITWLEARPGPRIRRRLAAIAGRLRRTAR